MPQIGFRKLWKVEQTHTTGARAESHGQIVDVPTPQIQDEIACGDPVDSTGARFRGHP